MPVNPFEVTKAVDFTDGEIAENWVDLPGGGFTSFADPRSPMPTFLVGGKGGGRTHLLRYFSSSVQRVRHSSLLSAVQSDGYLGIYFRCGGLNSSRFGGKRQDADTWTSVFAYFTEIWLARLAVDLIYELVGDGPELTSAQEFTRVVQSLFDVELGLDPESTSPFGDLIEALRRIQRDIDIAVNNAALSHKLDVRIDVSPGRLVFGIPQAAVKVFPAIRNVRFAYLADEFENLTEPQQRYVNTLIREKQLPSTFLIGSRKHGLRTHITLSAGEENRQGSEFELVVLEDTYRLKSHNYHRFCETIVRRRLDAAGLDNPAIKLESLFVAPMAVEDTLEMRAATVVKEQAKGEGARPWLDRLHGQLRDHGHASTASEIVDQIAIGESPLHEKFAAFLLYRAWSDGKDLLAAARTTRERMLKLRDGSNEDDRLATTYKHYRTDMYAQLLDQLGLPQEYCGLSEFVRMSAFLPRNLLVILKQITRWSLFFGDLPYRGDKLSLDAQREGVREASTWFLRDAKGMGRIGEETQLAIRRLGGLFREMRFSDKPAEVACSTFSTDQQGLSSEAAAVLHAALTHDLLVEAPKGRRERNSRVWHYKYQLNPMLAPLFNLSLARRGSVALSGDDLTAIFDPGVAETAFIGVQRKILNRLRVPFNGQQSQAALRFE